MGKRRGSLPTTPALDADSILPLLPPTLRRLSLSPLESDEDESLRPPAAAAALAEDDPIPLASSYSDDTSRASTSLPLKLSRYTPVKIVRKPHRRDTDLTSSLSEMLKPWKRMKEAARTAVVNVT